MLVKVTQQHIDEGKCNDIFRCAVALAIKEALNASNVVVSVDDVDLCIDRIWYIDCPLPEEAKVFIRKYDFYKGLKVTPFEFEFNYLEYRKDNNPGCMFG